MGKAIFKFNNGNGALLCSKCSVIIKEGYQFTEDEWKGMKGEKHIDPQYCDKCKSKDVILKQGDRCPHCIQLSKSAGEHPVGILEVVKETFPYDTDHLMCPICESTFVIE